MNIMDNIRRRQSRAVMPTRQTPPRHEPEMLYIGCVDARLDPVDDIGIEKGKALIFRNIGAIVLHDDPKENAATDHLPQNASIGAVLEFYLNHLPAPDGQVKHIVVSGHTDCGGIKACLDAPHTPGDHHLAHYLDTLQSVRARTLQEAAAKNWDEEQILHALEKESVRQSMANLRTYGCVQRALDEGRLELHGWIIDTATQHIHEMNLATLEFEPMDIKP